MVEENVDLEKSNAIGGLDRITTNIAIALISVFPTFFVSIATPWRLVPLITEDEPRGRSGYLIAPGAYLPLAILVTLLGAAVAANAEIASNSGAFLGPNLALSVQSAVAEGNIWQVVSTALPIYVFAVVVGAFGGINRILIGRDWSKRRSLRSTFYVVGTVISFILIATALIDFLRFSVEYTEAAMLLLAFVPAPIIGIILWMYVWFFRVHSNSSWWRCMIASIIMFALHLGVLILAELIIVNQ